MKFTCPKCDGEGKVTYIVRSKAKIIHEEVGKCEYCNGTGEVEEDTFSSVVHKIEITMPFGCPDFYGLKEAPATSRGCSHCKECWEEAIENWLNKKYKEA